jgi:hypothetical protein
VCGDPEDLLVDAVPAILDGFEPRLRTLVPRNEKVPLSQSWNQERPGRGDVCMLIPDAMQQLNG